MNINYGPLAGLIGAWKGGKGEDIIPDQLSCQQTTVANNYGRNFDHTVKSVLTRA